MGTTAASHLKPQEEQYRIIIAYYISAQSTAAIPDVIVETIRMFCYEKGLEELKATYRVSSTKIRPQCTRIKDNAIFELKLIDLAKKSATDINSIWNEIRYLSILHHPNIIEMVDVFCDACTVYVVFEYLECDMFDCIVENGHFSEADAKAVCRDLMLALQYIHAKGIVHRNIKPESLFMRTPKSKSMKLRFLVEDIGLAACLFEDGDQKGTLRTPTGTPGYVAPEILHKKRYNEKVDLWSAGVFLYILLCGFPPFYVDHDDADSLGNTNTAMYEKIKRGDYDMPSPYWDSVSTHAKDLVHCLLSVDPDTRPDASQTLQHKWFKDDEQK